MGTKTLTLNLTQILLILALAFALWYFGRDQLTATSQVSRETRQLLEKHEAMISEIRVKDSVATLYRDSLLYTQSQLLEEFAKLEKTTARLRDLNEKSLSQLSALRSDLGVRPDF